MAELLGHFTKQLIPDLLPMLLRGGELFWNPTAGTPETFAAHEELEFLVIQT